MTENKRFFYMSGIIFDNTKDKREWGISINDLDKGLRIVNLLNEQEELIKRLKTIREEQTETILKQKRKIKELEERNQRQYDRLKELGDLILKKDWKTLENIANEWEKQEKLLEQEWNKCEDL